MNSSCNYNYSSHYPVQTDPTSGEKQPETLVATAEPGNKDNTPSTQQAVVSYKLCIVSYVCHASLLVLKET